MQPKVRNTIRRRKHRMRAYDALTTIYDNADTLLYHGRELGDDEIVDLEAKIKALVEPVANRLGGELESEFERIINRDDRRHAAS